MKEKVGCSSWAKASVRLLRKGEVKLTGHLKLFLNGRVVFDGENTILDALKFQSAKGAATGTFVAFTGGKVKLIDSGTAEYDCDTTLIAGGTGAEDYVKYRFTWQNTEGEEKTINTAEFRSLAGTHLYCNKTGLTQVVPNQYTVAGEWTITATFGSGGVADLYRCSLALMFHNGQFWAPEKINFIDTVPADHIVTASLEDGGTGAENYHQWTATYVATGAITIDILELRCSEPINIYTRDDIVDKSLDTDEELIGRVRIIHN